MANDAKNDQKKDEKTPAASVAATAAAATPNTPPPDVKPQLDEAEEAEARAHAGGPRTQRSMSAPWLYGFFEVSGEITEKRVITSKKPGSTWKGYRAAAMVCGAEIELEFEEEALYDACPTGRVHKFRGHFEDGPRGKHFKVTDMLDVELDMEVEAFLNELRAAKATPGQRAQAFMAEGVNTPATNGAATTAGAMTAGQL
jgi:hypothetical protein